MNDVIRGIIARRSIRSYGQRQIAEEELGLILDAGLHAPTAKNTQGCIFTVLQGKALERLGGAITKSMLDMVKRGILNAPIDETYCCYYHAPTLIVVSEDRENQNGYGDCSCALENMMIAASSLGLGSCWINQVRPVCDDPHVRSVLSSFGLPESHIPYGSAAIGYPAGEPREIVRREGRILRP